MVVNFKGCQRRRLHELAVCREQHCKVALGVDDPDGKLGRLQMAAHFTRAVVLKEGEQAYNRALLHTLEDQLGKLKTKVTAML